MSIATQTTTVRKFHNDEENTVIFCKYNNYKRGYKLYIKEGERYDYEQSRRDTTGADIQHLHSQQYLDSSTLYEQRL